MSFELYDTIADKIAMECNAPEHHIFVTTTYNQNDGYRYLISSAKLQAGVTPHMLSCAETSEERLRKHVEGYIENMSPFWRRTNPSFLSNFDV